MLGLVSSCLTIKEQLACTSIHGDSEETSSSCPIRISIKHNDKTETVCWYGAATPLDSIESAVRAAFSLPKKMRFFLRNEKSEIVPLSHTLPPNQTYTLISSHNNCEEKDDESDSDSDSDSDSSEEEAESDEDKPPPRTDRTNLVATVTFKKPVPPTQSIVEIIHTNSNDIKSYPKHEGVPEIEHSASKRELPSSCADDKKKRKRRKAVEIERSYKCNVGPCHKVYGSENALKMHIKLKHPDYINITPMVMMHAQISTPQQSSSRSPPPTSFSYRHYPVPQPSAVSSPPVSAFNAPVRYPAQNVAAPPPYVPTTNRADIANLMSTTTVPSVALMHLNGSKFNTPTASTSASSPTLSNSLPSIHSITNNLPQTPFHFVHNTNATTNSNLLPTRNLPSLNTLVLCASKS